MKAMALTTAIEPATTSVDVATDRSSRAKVSPARASAPSRPPAQSTWAPPAAGSRLSGTCRWATITTTTASGRLIKNTQRHEATSTSQPPSSGPIAVATPPRPDQAPIARARSAGRKLDCRIARLPGREQGRADALHRSRRDQHLDVHGETAGEGRGGEPHDTDHEHATSTVPVTQRAAEQDERGQGQGVGRHRPLQRGEVGIQRGADRGQRDVHDGGVDAGQG